MRPRDLQLRNRILLGTGLALGTLCLYLPVLYHDFVNYDDQQYVTDNPRVQAGLTWAGVKWAFGFYAGNWHPLAWLSHMLDCQLYGAWAGGHHLTSLLLHTAATVLLFVFLDRTTGAPWRSAAAAALFAWHPLHVESVAWVAERKDVLCAFFWMLTLLAYAHYAKHDAGPVPGGPQATASRFFRHASGSYGLALLCFVLALMSKPMAVTLPLVLLLLDFWPLGRMRKDGRGGRSLVRLALEKVPFLLLAIGGCVLTLHAQQIAIVSTAGLTITQRLSHALVAYVHYLGAMFVPVNLAVYYPYQIHLPAAIILVAAPGLVAVTFLTLAAVRRRPYLAVGWFWYLGTLVPVIGLVQVGDQAWADRYTYLPLIGPFIMIVWLAAEFVRQRVLVAVSCALAAAGLFFLTGRQLSYWQDTRTLFERANRAVPDNYMAITMLGSILAQEHRYDEAIRDYQTALRIQPTFPEAHFFLGAALDEQGKLAPALVEYQQALWFKPTQEQTHLFMGIALAKEKEYAAAAEHYQAALKLNPDSAAAHNNLARVLHTEGRLAEAAAHYRTALALDPKLALAHNNLGILLIQQGQVAAGIEQLRAALRWRPGNAETEFNLALALAQMQQWAEAADLFGRSLGSHSNDANAHDQYAVALAHLKKTRQAMSEYAGALLLQPDFPNALDGLAWILSTAAQPEFRNGGQAVPLAERAVYLTGNKDPHKLMTLAAAYAEAGRFAEATNALGRAWPPDQAGAPSDLTALRAAMLQRFQHGEPWREP